MNRVAQYCLRITPKLKVLIILVFSLIFCQSLVSQNITWQKVLINPGISYFTSVVQTPDQGYIATGRHHYINNYMYVVRFDKYGDTLWTKEIDRGDATCIIKANDNNYVICGRLGSFVKIDINGNTLIESSIINESARLLKVRQGNDDNYYMCGYIYSSGSFYPYLLKYNDSGVLLWDSIYSGGIIGGEFGDLVLTDDNNLVIAGNYFQKNGQPSKLFLMKTNQQGNQVWITTVDSYNYLYPRAIIKTEADSYFISCVQSAILKFNSAGVFQWRKDYDTLTQTGITSMVNTIDGKIVYTAYYDPGNSTSVRIRKIDTNGVEMFSKNLGFENHNHTPWDIRQTLDSGFVVVGRTDFSNEDAYILKTNKYGELPIAINIVSSEVPNRFKLYQNYPNPFNPVTKIKFDITEECEVKLRIYDILGKELTTLLDQYMETGTYEITFKPHNLSSGNYFYQLLVYNKNTLIYTNTKKLQLLK